MWLSRCIWERSMYLTNQEKFLNWFKRKTRFCYKKDKFARYLPIDLPQNLTFACNSKFSYENQAQFAAKSLLWENIKFGEIQVQTLIGGWWLT